MGHTMSKISITARNLLFLLTGLSLTLACARRDGPDIRWVGIPGGTAYLGSRTGRPREAVRTVTFAPFRMSATEVTVGQFLPYCKGTAVSDCASPQLERLGDYWRAKGRLDMPITGITRKQATDFAAWLSKKQAKIIRLPTGDEWEYAARAGVDGAPFPWGWDSPTGRAQFNAEGPSRVARFAPNRWGLYDMAGNVAEWCGNADQTCGGSWSDRAETSLRVFTRTSVPENYADADVGFRLLCEIPSDSSGSQPH